MYRLWESLLVTKYVAIAAAKGPPEYWLPEGAHLVRQKVANYHKEVVSQAKKMRVGRSRVRIMTPAKFFTLKFPLNRYSQKSSACSTINCVCEMQFIIRPVLHLWQMYLISIKQCPGSGQKNLIWYCSTYLPKM